MANDVKRTALTAYRRVDTPVGRPTASARLTLSSCLVALAVLLTQLPGPAEAVAVLSGAAGGAVAASAPLAAVQEILLVTAGLLAWVLAGWTMLVLAIGVTTRLPGRPGRRARRLLPRIAPASVGRVVLAAVGASLIAGTAACAVPGPSTAAGTAWTAGAAPTSATTNESGPGPSATAPAGSISIDWPAPVTTPPTPPTSSPAAAGSPASSPPTSWTIPPTPTPTTSIPTPTPTPTPTTQATATPATPPPATAPPPAPPGNPATTPPAGAPGVTTTPTPEAAPVMNAPAVPPAASDSAGRVTVRPGDSLWRIAAGFLGPDATDAEIDNAWRAWYFVNRQIIGDDPDVIAPGQDLMAPGDAGQVRR